MSAFRAAPGIAPVKVEVYPKRHGHSSFPRERVKATRADMLAEAIFQDPGRDVAYADFFVSPASDLRFEPDAGRTEAAA